MNRRMLLIIFSIGIVLLVPACGNGRLTYGAYQFSVDPASGDVGVSIGVMYENGKYEPWSVITEKFQENNPNYDPAYNQYAIQVTQNDKWHDDTTEDVDYHAYTHLQQVSWKTTDIGGNPLIWHYYQENPTLYNAFPRADEWVMHETCPFEEIIVYVRNVPAWGETSTKQYSFICKDFEDFVSRGHTGNLLIFSWSDYVKDVWAD